MGISSRMFRDKYTADATKPATYCQVRILYGLVPRRRHPYRRHHHRVHVDRTPLSADVVNGEHHRRQDGTLPWRCASASPYRNATQYLRPIHPLLICPAPAPVAAPPSARARPKEEARVGRRRATQGRGLGCAPRGGRDLGGVGRRRRVLRAGGGVGRGGGRLELRDRAGGPLVHDFAGCWMSERRCERGGMFYVGSGGG